MAVNTPSEGYALYQRHRSLTNTMRGGTFSMQQAGKLYLPQEPLETPTAYQNRLERSRLTNWYVKASDKFSGKITRKTPALLEQTPQQIVDLEDNIDNQGHSVTQFTESILTVAIDDGVAFAFIDTPAAPQSATGDDDPDAPPRTRAQDDALGIRPYVRIVDADALLGWKYEVVNGKNVLLQIRMHEWITEPDPDDEFNEIAVEQIRVVEPFLHRLFRLRTKEDGKKEWVEEENIATDFEEIPLVPLYTNQKGFLLGEPLFMDLAHLNLAHWQSDSDQTNIVHAIRVPILFGQGLAANGEEVQLNIGPNSLTVGEPGSDLKYVEHTGKAAEVGYKSLERLEDNIVSMGIDIVMNKRPGNATATARALDQAEVDSEMATVSTNVEDMWREIFRHMMVALGEDTENADMEQIGVNMNKDFALGLMDLNGIKELLAMRASGDLSQQSLWFELKRHGILSEDFDEEMEQELLDLEKEANMEREAKMMREMEQIGADPFGEGNPDDDEDDEDDDDSGGAAG